MTRPTTSMTAKVSRYCTSLTRERTARRHEEEVERGDVDEGRQHRRAAPVAAAPRRPPPSRNSMTMLASSKYGTQRHAPAASSAAQTQRQRTVAASGLAPASRFGVAAAAPAPRRAIAAPAPTSMTSMSGASCARPVWPSDRASGQPGRARRAPDHELRQVVRARVVDQRLRPRSAPTSVGRVGAQLLRQLAAFAGCARAAPSGRRCSAGVSTYTACQGTSSCARQPRGAAHHLLGARRPGRRRHSSALSVCHTGATDAVGAVGLHICRRRGRRCGAAPARAARSGCPCGRSSATARSACSGR